MATKLKDLKLRAYKFGVDAFNNGLKAVPHHDVSFHEFLKNEVPEGRRLLMYKQWSKAWHTSNANAFVDYCKAPSHECVPWRGRDGDIGKCIYCKS